LILERLRRKELPALVKKIRGILEKKIGKVSDYKASVRSDWPKTWGRIECFGKIDGVNHTLSIHFLRQGEERSNYIEWVEGVRRGFMYIPAELYPWILDILRNEKPFL